MPARHLVMIQCAGSRDQRRLPYCSRLCCMVALKHAIRLRALFPEMRVTICFQELRTPAARDETWYLAARRAGVEFVRGSPAAVEVDGEGRPVVDVEDLAAGELRRLRPDLVVLSTGLVPTAEAAPVAHLLGVPLDDAGFVAQLDAKNRTTETRAEGVFVCGSASGPKTLAECITDAAAAAARVHEFLSSGGRQHVATASVDPERCVGLRSLPARLPVRRGGARRSGGRAALRPPAVRPDAPVAEVDADACRGCGICAASCPELAISHSLDDATVIARLEVLTAGTESPVIGFTCAECASAAFTLSGLRRDQYPERVRLIELPCLGRISALAPRRGGAPRRRRRLPRRLRRGPVPVHARRSERRGAGGAGRRAGAPGRPHHAHRALAALRRRSPRHRPSHRELLRPGRRRPCRAPTRPRLAGAAGGSRPPVPWGWAMTAVAEPTRLAAADLAVRCRSCYQCGRCRSACPQGLDLAGGPRAVVRLILAGEVEALLGLRGRLALQRCGACTEACPMGVDVAGMLAEVRAPAAGGGPRPALPGAERRGARRPAAPAATPPSTA